MMHTFQHEAMATHWEVIIAQQENGYAQYAAEATFRELDRLETLLSRFIESSDIARANHLEIGETTAISDETLECLLIAADISLVTGRAFDPAYHSLRPADLASDLTAYTLDPTAHTLTSRATQLHLDLGAVGKGYALDRMAEILLDWAIPSACLNAGGSSVLALAPPTPTASGWPIGLGEGPHRRTLSLKHASLSASGTAVQGPHLIDPRTGQPSPRVTRTWAFAPNAAQADALSTAFFIMEQSTITALCTAHPQVGAALTSLTGDLSVYGALRTQLDR